MKEGQTFPPYPPVQYSLAFRFEEIREVVHIMNKDCGANVPRSSQLSLNYRSHTGIVALGMAVVGLLRKYFSVDFMASAEVAALQGERLVCILVCVFWGKCQN